MVGIVATLIAVMWMSPVVAQTITAPDYKVKAGFIYNFVKLTVWPTNAFKSLSDPIRIGVVGDNELAGYLEEEVKGRLIDGRALSVSRFKPGLLVTNCQVLFVSSSISDDVDPIPEAVRDRPILTIGESEKFTQAGGIIRLVRKGSALQFEVDQSAANRAGLRLSSKLLALAKPRFEGKRP